MAVMPTFILPQPDALPLEEAWTSFSRALRAEGKSPRTFTARDPGATRSV
jgi:hypothetical protein